MGKLSIIFHGANARKHQPWSLILITLAISILLLLGSEASILVLRWSGAAPLEVYGTGNHDLEQRLNHLDAFCREQGSPEYIFIGNSKVGQGVDEPVVVDSFQETAGFRPGCVNFGFGGNTTEFLPVILRILEEDFSPRFFVIDLMGPYQSSTFDFQSSQWIQYRMGNFNISGWMIEHFHFMRVFLMIRHWMEQPREDYQFRAALRDRGRVRDIGFSEEKRRELLEREKEARRDEEIFKAFPDEIPPGGKDEEEAFSRIISLAGPEKLVFFELPLSFRITRSLGDYRYRRERSDELARKHGIPLLRIPDPGDLPLESWMRDGLHMEEPGIAAFSDWLGRALAGLGLSGGQAEDGGHARGGLQ